MLNNILERPEAQDTGSIILTGFDPEIVLSSVRTVIEEQNNSLPAVWQEHKFFEFNVICDYQLN